MGVIFAPTEKSLPTYVMCFLVLHQPHVSVNSLLFIRSYVGPGNRHNYGKYVTLGPFKDSGRCFVVILIHRHKNLESLKYSLEILDSRREPIFSFRKSLCFYWRSGNIRKKPSTNQYIYRGPSEEECHKNGRGIKNKEKKIQAAGFLH